MLTDDVRIHFLGFHPAPATEATLYEWADELHTEGPGRNCIKVLVQRTGDKTYRVDVHMFSHGKDFYFRSEGRNLYTAARDALRNSRRQLDKWKTIVHRRQRLRDHSWAG